MTATENQDLLLYLQICADSYGESKPQNCDNTFNSDWQRLNLVINGVVSGQDYYGFDLLNGFDAAIYYNEETNKVIVGIRGTEALANDGDVSESANILNQITELTQFGELINFHQVIQDTLKSINYDGSYKIVGQSLGGALASVYIQQSYTDNTYVCTEAIAINTIGVSYAFDQSQSDKVTNYLVMNDIFAMLNYDQQIGSVKLVCRLGFNPTETIEIAEKRVA